MTNEARVSVITVVKENSDGLLRTFESLQSQNYKEWELIIVGTSENDETGKLGKELSKMYDNVKFLLREPKGIYEAMNFGATHAKSDFLWFMNAGDIFANKSAISIGLRNLAKPEIDLLIGNHVYKGELKPRRKQNKPRYINTFGFAFSLRISHQAMIFRKDQFDLNQGYSNSYKYVADTDLVLRIMKGKNTFLIPDILAEVETGGFSDANLMQLFAEKHQVRKEYFNNRMISFVSFVWNKLAAIKIRFS